MRALDWLLVALLAVVCGLLALTTPSPTARNVDFLPQMVRPVAARAYSANRVFADGQTIQLPPPGTVPHGLPPLPYAATPEDAARAGRELANPFPASDAPALQRGGFIFQTYCQVCHGPGGKGDGPVAQRGFPMPPTLLAEHARKLPDGQIFHIMTFGQNNMPGYAAQIARADRWRAVLYVRELQRLGPVVPDAAPTAAAKPPTEAPR